MHLKDNPGQLLVWILRKLVYMKALLTFTIFTVSLFSSLMAFGQESAIHTERTSFGKSISLYPNPAVEYIEVNLDQLHARTVKLTLYNIIGNEVQAETEVIDDHKIRVRVKDFSAGYYLLALRDDETKFKGTYKFLKR